jgi:hypothetical protein
LRVVRSGSPAPDAGAVVGNSADRLTTWVGKRMGELVAGGRQPTIVELNRFKVRLVDRLLAEYLATPEPQRSIVRDCEETPGLIGVFLTTLETIAELALAAEPPPLWEPPKPARRKTEKEAPAPQPAGTWFAVEEE